MLLGWGVLLPAGVLIARYLKWKGPLWLKLHIRLQESGFHANYRTWTPEP